jgi:hypothetical protein
VDVSNVTFVDLEGERVLAAMIKDGAHFIATGVYTKHILETLQKRRHRWIRKFIGCSWPRCLCGSPRMNVYDRKKKAGFLVMAVYALMVVLAIDLFLIVLGDGTNHSRRWGR